MEKESGLHQQAYQPFYHFTAQSKTVEALMAMYANLEGNSSIKMPLTPFVVFLAFAIESYANSIGARMIDFWDEIERLPWRNKIEILHKKAEKRPDWGKDPLQFAIDVFKLRDRLAHGKMELVCGPIFPSATEAQQYDPFAQKLQPKWYADLTKDWVIQGKERFFKLMLYLGALFDLPESDYLKISSGGVFIDDGLGSERLLAGTAPSGELGKKVDLKNQTWIKNNASK